MKKFALAWALLLPFSTHAQTELVCWDTYTKKGTPPVLKATIAHDTDLAHLTFDLKAPLFAPYFQDQQDEAGHTKSFLQNPEGTQIAELITNPRSPYKGHHQYTFEFGRHSFQTPDFFLNDSYGARLILPVSLSNAHLQSARLRPDARVNAVLLYPAHTLSHHTGDNALKMFCVSK